MSDEQHPNAEALLDPSLTGERADPAVESHAQRCAACRAERLRLREALDLVGLAANDSAPSEEARERLLQSIAARPRFARFATRVAELCGLPALRARAYLARLDELEAWHRTDTPGLSMFDVECGGPGVRAVFVKLERGHVIPHQLHAARETALCLQGRFETNGGVIGPGDELSMAPGAAHGLRLLPGPSGLTLLVSRDEPVA